MQPRKPFTDEESKQLLKNNLKKYIPNLISITFTKDSKDHLDGELVFENEKVWFELKSREFDSDKYSDGYIIEEQKLEHMFKRKKKTNQNFVYINIFTDGNFALWNWEYIVLQPKIYKWCNEATDKSRKKKVLKLVRLLDYECAYKKGKL